MNPRKQPSRLGLFARPRRLLGLALLALHLPAGAQEHAAHVRLHVDPALGWSEVFEQTLSHAPAALEAPVRARQAEDFAAAGRGWLAERPSLQLNFYDDGPLDDRGQRELEYGLQLPLRRPGEWREARRLGEGYTAQSEAFAALLRWELAGQLRASFADIREAEVLLALETEAEADAAELLRITEALAEAGEVPELEALQARSLLLSQQRNLLHAEAALVDAERAYVTLTGLTGRPELPLAETPTLANEVSSQHPWLRYLSAGVALAEAGIAQSRHEARGAPTLSIGARRERGDRFTPYTDSINLSLSLPIGGKALVDAQTSGARRDKAEAEIAQLSAQRELDAALHATEHDLEVVDAGLALAREQAALAERRAAMAQAAFEQGETTLAQAVLALQQARLDQRELRELELRRERLVAEFNQTLGVLP